MGRRVAVPEYIRHALKRLLGDDVERVVVIERSLFARLHFRIEATTRKRRIYLVGTGEKFFGDPSLMLHEYCHVVKQWEPGHLTVARYLAEWWRRGYWDNRFEIEAREFAADNLYRFRALLRQSAQQRFPVVKPAGGSGEQGPKPQRHSD